METRSILSMLLKRVTEYCAHCNSSNIQVGRRLYYLTQLIIQLQTLSLVIPPTSDENLPWNYKTLNPLWQALGLISRTDYFIKLLNLPSFLVLLHLCSYHIALMFHMYKFALFYLRSGSCQDNLKVEVRWEFIDRLETVLRYLLSDLSLLPVMFSLTSLSGILRDYNISQSMIYLILTLITLPIILVFLIDSLYLQPTNWVKRPHNLISIPRHVLHKRLAILSLIICSNIISFSEHPEVRSTLQIFIGGYIIYTYIYNQPYASLGCNIMESMQGVIILLSGFIFLIIDMNGLNSENQYITELLFFFTLPMVSYIILYLAQWLRMQMSSQMSNSSDLNRMFRVIWELGKENSEEDESLYIKSDAAREYIHILNNFHATNGWSYIWIIYYLILKKNWIGAHIVLSQSNKATNTLECSVYLAECKQTIRKELEALNSIEWEGYNYINFREHFTRLLAQDKYCCHLARLKYHDLLFAFNGSYMVSKDYLKLLKEIKKTKKLYEYMLANFEPNSELLLLYTGFLKTFLGTPSTKEIQVKAQQQLDQEIKASELKGKELNFFHSDNMKVAVSLEPENVGEIVWVYNSQILGYDDESIEKESFKLLIPSPIKENHDCMMKHATSLFRPHTIFNLTHDLYMIHRNKYLVPIYLKERMANSSSNKILMVSSIKIHYDGKEIAFLHEDGSIASMVTCI